MVADSAIAPLAKFAVAWPLAYHFGGAVRHAIWDNKAVGFTNQKMLMSSYVLFGVSTAVSLAAASITLPTKDKKK
jgi:succinate dehydrogenase (ubiquinone) cytochrome b560 subunit